MGRWQVEDAIKPDEAEYQVEDSEYIELLGSY